MNFLNPTLLWALAAAAAPLLIHLLSRRKRKRQLFSSIIFLQELQRKEMKRLKLRQLILLIIRTLILIFIVAAFSRPALRGYMPGADASTSVVIIIDNSLSMVKQSETDSKFTRAVAVARNLLGTLGARDEKILLEAVPLPVENVSETQSGFRKLADISSLNQSAGSAELDEAISEAIDEMRGTSAANREIYLISDFTGASPPPKMDSLLSLPDNTRLFFIPVHGEEPNAYIASIDVETRLLRAGGSAKINISVASDSDEKEERRLDLYLDGLRVGQTTVEPILENPATVSFEVSLKKAGHLLGFAELEEDALFADNKRFFDLRVPETINVLVVGTDEQTFYLRTALDAANTDRLRTRVSSVQPAELRNRTISRYDAIFLTNLPADPVDAVSSLQKFVSDGGGVLLFPADKTGELVVNRLARAFGIPELSESVTGAGTEGYLDFDYVNWKHPLFSGVFSEFSAKLSSPAVREKRDFVSPGGTDLVRLSDGKAFIREYRHGAGRILVMAAPPTLAWTDFPVKGLWLPFVTRSAEYLATGSESFSDSTAVGDRISFTVPDDYSTHELTVLAPDGVVYSTLPKVSAGGITTQFSATSTPGHYLLKGGETLLDVHSVNIASTESEPRSSLAELASRYEAVILDVQNPADVVKSIAEARFGTELWRYFAAAAFLLLLLEMVLQRRIPDSELVAPPVVMKSNRPRQEA